MLIRLVLLLLAAWVCGGSTASTSGAGSAALSVLTGDLAGRCAAAVLAWVLLGALASRLVRLPGLLGALARGAMRVLVPRALRATVLGLAGSQAVLGLAVAGGPPPLPAAGPGAAASLAVQRPLTGDRTPILVPAAVTAAGPVGPIAVPPPLAVLPPPQSVEVAPGDTLWTIAARHLPPGASAAAIAAAWPAWFETNLAVIGPDPDLLTTGTVLAVPAPGAAAPASLAGDLR